MIQYPVVSPYELRYMTSTGYTGWSGSGTLYRPITSWPRWLPLPYETCLFFQEIQNHRNSSGETSPLILVLCKSRPRCLVLWEDNKLSVWECIYKSGPTWLNYHIHTTKRYDHHIYAPQFSPSFSGPPFSTRFQRSASAWVLITGNHVFMVALFVCLSVRSFVTRYGNFFIKETQYGIMNPSLTEPQDSSFFRSVSSLNAKGFTPRAALNKRQEWQLSIFGL